MRLSSPIPHKRARIEIIPLIDIMFFLLASFMMVSLSQVHMKGIRVWRRDHGARQGSLGGNHESRISNQSGRRSGGTTRRSATATQALAQISDRRDSIIERARIGFTCELH